MGQAYLRRIVHATYAIATVDHAVGSRGRVFPVVDWGPTGHDVCPARKRTTEGISMRRMKWLLLSAFTALLCSLGADADAPAAAATSAATKADVRCMIVAMQMGQVPGATAQTAGLLAMYYYLGRLDGRAPDADLATLIEDEVRDWTAADNQSESLRCGSEITTMGRRLQVIGERLVERGKKQELEERQSKQ
jgi:hypothetical protein